MDKEKIKSLIAKTVIKLKELFDIVVKVSKVVYAKIKEKMPIVKRIALKIFNLTKAMLVKLFIFIKAKTPVVCKFIKEKSIVVYNEIKKNPKQVLVAFIIFVFAMLLLFFTLRGSNDNKVVETVVTKKEITIEKKVEKTLPTTAVLRFTADTQKALTFDVFYTVEREIWFDAGHIVSHQGKEGLNDYEIELPVDKVYRIRLDFDSAPGEVKLSNMNIYGTQNVDLTDTSNYDYSNIDNVEVNQDGSITFISNQEDPYIIYGKSLLPE